MKQVPNAAAIFNAHRLTGTALANDQFGAVVVAVESSVTPFLAAHDERVQTRHLAGILTVQLSQHFTVSGSRQQL
jgi:hypothetical protein